MALRSVAYKVGGEALTGKMTISFSSAFSLSYQTVPVTRVTSVPAADVILILTPTAPNGAQKNVKVT